MLWAEEERRYVGAGESPACPALHAGLGDEDADMLQQFQRWTGTLISKLAGKKHLQAAAARLSVERLTGLAQEQQHESVSTSAPAGQEQPGNTDGAGHDEFSGDEDEEDGAGSEVRG
jgi:hypothetical protein